VVKSKQGVKLVFVILWLFVVVGRFGRLLVGLV